MLRRKLPYILASVFFFVIYIFGCLSLYFVHTILPVPFHPSDVEVACFAMGFGFPCFLQGFWSFIDSIFSLFIGKKEKV